MTMTKENKVKCLARGLASIGKSNTRAVALWEANTAGTLGRQLKPVRKVTKALERVDGNSLDLMRIATERHGADQRARGVRSFSRKDVDLRVARGVDGVTGRKPCNEGAGPGNWDGNGKGHHLRG